jgi:transposase
MMAGTTIILNPPLPDAVPEPLPHWCPTCQRLISELEGWRQAGYWQAQHRRAVDREQKLKDQNGLLEAEIRQLKQKIFGKSSEGRAVCETNTATPTTPKRHRGQQRGKPGPRKRNFSHLPAVEETHDLPEDAKQCHDCGRPLVAFSTTDDSEILEIEVKAHRRIIHRKKYRPSCSCPHTPRILTAAPAPRVIPKSIIGVSIWVMILLDKFLWGRPTERLLKSLQLHGLDLSLGTITDGLQKLEPLFTPLYEAMIEHSQEQKLWHADETRWEVFVTLEGKVGHRWYLWVFHGVDVVVFVLSPTRAHDVPEEHFGTNAEGILVVDRYRAYQAIEQVKNGKIVLAFCWAHVRRDFLKVAKGFPEQESWGLLWVERIGTLYRLNDARLDEKADAPTQELAKQQLRAHVVTMAQQRDEELANPELPSGRAGPLTSLKNHWEGLTVFVDHPEVRMDNNTAERAQRGPVVGRKNYYGSGSEWSGRLAAMLFGLFQTLCLADLNAQQWLTMYLQACAEAGGTAPPEAEQYLPWNLTDEQKKVLRDIDPPKSSNSS